MGSEDQRLPFLCECGDLGCEKCVPATRDEFAADLLFSPGHEPEREGSVAEIDR